MVEDVRLQAVPHHQGVYLRFWSAKAAAFTASGSQILRKRLSPPPKAASAAGWSGADGARPHISSGHVLIEQLRGMAGIVNRCPVAPAHHKAGRSRTAIMTFTEHGPAAGSACCQPQKRIPEILTFEVSTPIT